MKTSKVDLDLKTIEISNIILASKVIELFIFSQYIMSIVVVLLILLIIIWIWKNHSESFDTQGHHEAWLRSNGVVNTADTSTLRNPDARGLSIYDYFYENILFKQNQEINENEIYNQTPKRNEIYQ